MGFPAPPPPYKPPDPNATNPGPWPSGGPPPSSGSSGGGGGGGGGRQANQTSATGSLAGGVVNYTFYATPGASASATQMNKSGIGAAASAGMPFRGSIVAMSLASNAVKTAGTCKFVARVNGNATSAVLDWANSVTHAVQRFTPRSQGFVRDATIDVTFETSSGYAPTTTLVEIVVMVIVDQQEIL